MFSHFHEPPFLKWGCVPFTSVPSGHLLRFDANYEMGRGEYVSGHLENTDLILGRQNESLRRKENKKRKNPQPIKQPSHLCQHSPCIRRCVCFLIFHVPAEALPGTLWKCLHKSHRHPYGPRNWIVNYSTVHYAKQRTIFRVCKRFCWFPSISSWCTLREGQFQRPWNRAPDGGFSNPG